ncbi:MAG: hypothetical protein KDB14_02715 [Planctomycetales bacterium]|nr:hypothetical protein [Planctomycetales bacterium]
MTTALLATTTAIATTTGATNATTTIATATGATNATATTATIIAAATIATIAAVTRNRGLVHVDHRDRNQAKKGRDAQNHQTIHVRNLQNFETPVHENQSCPSVVPDATGQTKHGSLAVV